MEYQEGSNVTLEELYDAVDLSKRDLTEQVSRDSNEASGEGAFAEVHRGTWNIPQYYTDPQTGIVFSWVEPCPVAIKELRLFTKRHPNWLKIINKLFHEMGIWCWLNHTNILPFYGYTTNVDGGVGLISQWCEFGNLNEYLKHHPDASREDLALDVAEGIAYLHGHSPPIIHADLKAANILVNYRGIACICDFGISTFAEDAGVLKGFTTTSDLQGGSIPWMAAELLEGLNARKTFESDMYAFGGVLLEIFTGQKPYHYLKSDSLVIVEIMKGEPPLREMYDTSEEHDTYWNIAQCLWNPEASMRPTAQATVNSLFASFNLRPRLDENQARRPKVAIIDGSLHKLGEVIVESSPDLISEISLSPDATTYCQEVRNTHTNSEVLFYDLNGDAPENFWSIQVARGFSAMHYAWNSSSSVVVLLTRTSENLTLLTVANIRTKEASSKSLDLPSTEWRAETVRFTSDDQLAIAFSLKGGTTLLHLYSLPDDLTTLENPGLEAQANPVVEDRSNWRVTELTPHGACLRSRQTTFDVLEPTGGTPALCLLQDRQYFDIPGLQYLCIADIQEVAYLDSENEPPLVQHIFYRLSIAPPPLDESHQERYSLSKMDLCLPHNSHLASATFGDWYACMFANKGVWIWHGSAALPLVTVDLEVPQGTEEELNLKLVVCQGTATVAIFPLKLDEEYHLARIYRIPLPDVN